MTSPHAATPGTLAAWAFVATIAALVAADAGRATPRRAPTAAPTSLTAPAARAVVRLRVVDRAGRPVPWALVQATADRRLKRPPLDAPDLNWISAHTREDGVAEVEGLDVGSEYRLLVYPPPRRRDLFEASIEAWRAADGEVVLTPDEVRGRVLDLDRHPVPGAVLDVGRDRFESADPVGSFRLVGVPPYLALRVGPPPSPVGKRHSGLEACGGVRSPVSLGDLLADAPDVDVAPLTVRRGTDDAVLLLHRRSELRIVVEDWPEGTEGYVSIVPETAAPRGSFTPPGRVVRVSRDGVAVLPYPRADLDFTVFVHPLRDDRSAERRRVRAGGVPVVVRLEAGAAIEGRLTGVPPAQVASVVVHRPDRPDLCTTGRVRRDGTYEVRGLPPGRWEIVARAEASGDTLWASGIADAGTTLDLEFSALRSR